MKKAMKIAVMLTTAGMMCAVIPIQPASAQIWTLVGSETETAFQDMIPVDDKGMLNFSGADCDYQVYLECYTGYHDAEVTDPITGETTIERIYDERCRVNLITPIHNMLWFVLREDQPDAEEQMLAIMERYYPEISSTFQQRVPNKYASLTPQFYTLKDGTSTGPHLYELWDLTEQAGSQERSDSIMHDLAEAGLITEFYTWGQSAYCQQLYGWLGYVEDYFDKELVESYLAEHAPNCSIKEIPFESSLTGNTWKDYALDPDENMSYVEQFALVVDIYKATDIRPAIWSFDDEQSALGQNALAVTGDVDLSCSIDVADAVLLARFCAEDEEAVITDQGKANADYNADGDITQDDVVLILQKIARLI